MLETKVPQGDLDPEKIWTLTLIPIFIIVNLYSMAEFIFIFQYISVVRMSRVHLGRVVRQVQIIWESLFLMAIGYTRISLPFGS